MDRTGNGPMMALPRATRRPGATPFLLLLLLALAAPVPGEAQRQILDHDAYDLWRTIRGERVSGDGGWVLYQLAPRVGDAELVAARADARGEHRVERGGSARFSPDSRFVVFTVAPAHDSVRALRLRETRRADMPPDTLGILNLATGQLTRIPAVRSWKLPERGGSVVAYLVDVEPAPDTVAAAPDTAGVAVPVEPTEPPPGEPGVGPPPEEPVVEPVGQPVVEPAVADTTPSTRPERTKPEGRTLVVRDLGTGAEHRFRDVVDFAFSERGEALAYTATSPDGTADGVFLIDPTTGAVRPLLTGEGLYTRLAIAGDGRRVGFLSDRGHARDDQPEFALYVWTGERDGARRVAASGSAGVPDGWWVSEHGALRFSDSGRRLFFGTSPRPALAPAAADSLLPDERVRVDVWHWQDDHIQPMQLLNLEDERKRTYEAVVHLDRRDRIVQLATEAMPEVQVGGRGDGDVALAETDVPYRILVGIESPGYSDLWLIDVRDGQRRRVVENRQVGGAALSPESRFLAWYDFADRHWHALETARDRRVALTADVPFPVWNEDDDRPMHPSPYGRVGWTAGDREFLVYDRYDIWAVDPSGRAAPRAITGGEGRARSIRFRHVDLDPREPAIDRNAPLLLTAFHTGSKDAGFFHGRVLGADAPRELVFGPKSYGRPVRAEHADVLLYTREDVAEFPDLWVAGPDLRAPVRVSHANPQQQDYRWATVELVEWVSTAGVPLQGLLYRPDDFDRGRAYPMIVYFYERSSDGLHQHTPPLPHRSVIRPTFYASRGYLVFVPDIVYQEGYPGKSAMDAVMPGTLMLAAQPWVDEHNIGVQGHSWGGYQIAYMVTQTNLFRAAGAGAPVANMTSAYGGIRWGTGHSRIFQYERTQSRIAGSLWEQPLRYIENSPLFYLDRVQTPLLIMHNDEDGAVPFEQGIELFMALRRLGKPAWLINYNDQPHWPVTPANIRDWNIRLQQFFDHFLQGAPAPEWLVRGVPATEKGRTLGLDLVETGVARRGGDDGGGH
jgi:dipeptidyl aminopeptidase/acylaminoacyl peptidase